MKEGYRAVLRNKLFFVRRLICSGG
jgi:hypothetical protein